jgi:CelD/BcsL family acetyltransferase involved in cellulose biosynthesis
MTAVESWRCANREWTPLAVEIEHAGALTAAALIGYRARPGLTQAMRLGSPEEAGGITARSADDVGRLARGVKSALDDLGRPWVLRLAHLPIRDAATHQFIAAFEHVALCGQCNGVRLRLAEDASLSHVTTQNLRNAVAKARNRIDRDRRRLMMTWLTTPEEIDAVLPDVVRIHKARNIQLRGTSRLDNPATYHEFIARVRAHAREDRVRLVTTRIDDVLAAFALCLIDGRTLHVYANLVAPEWLAYSAGTITNHAVVKWAWSSRRVDIVDWGLGVQRYKLSGPTELDPHATYEIFSSRAAQRAVMARRRIRSAVRPLIERASELMR